METVERLLQKPIAGGVFGQGKYALASMPCVSRGLHSIKYMVVEPRAGAVLSVSEDKTEALAGARKVIAAGAELAQNDDCWQQLDLLEDLAAAGSRQAMPITAIGRVPHRRREIFDKSGGRCHYCGATLTLDGKWHVEHMLPRALGGADDYLNLVAACAPCNLSKADRTALEFVAQGPKMLT